MMVKPAPHTKLQALPNQPLAGLPGALHQSPIERISSKSSLFAFLHTPKT
jgi:hypothetical protein